MKSFKILLLVGLVGTSFQSAADVKIGLNQDVQPVVINGDELGFSLTSKKEFNLENGQNQIVVQIEKLVQNRGEYEKYNSVPVVITLEQADTSLTISPSSKIATTEDAKQFDKQPKFTVKNANNDVVNVQQDRLEALGGFTRDYEKELAAYNEANNIVLAGATSVSTTVAAKADVKISKPQEMVEYWYQEAEQSEKEAFSSWAFQNRKQVSEDLKTTGKPSEMLDYWYKKASEEQRSQILTWLLKVE
ncbi:DUF2057 domain-containing protein [Vibrio algivorus]|uniref:DUF2057 domain-containing protein n=1 Tax=Vibrio algivorus TaxID=1667024 RepID=A0A557PAF6_9VIBR|nr:DUF2057 domain-containing protein [Vibrio algivorus]TVO37631.1 DUF2057 domain-containing protein [Vibrio algivorus]